MTRPSSKTLPLVSGLKVAIISGGGSGIGRAIALAFAQEGAQVAVCGRDCNQLDAVAKQILSGRATAWRIQPLRRRWLASREPWRSTWTEV